MVYDLAICGGGPAGVSAGVYASRKRLSTVFITSNFESQSYVAENIQNWIGTISISGPELSDNLKKHLLAYADNVVNIIEGEYIIEITKHGENFVIKTDVAQHEAKAVLITTGSIRRKLTIQGAKEYENRGLTYCASCDGPLFADKDVAVIGGGNAGFETAAQLLAYAKSVTLLNRSDQYKADPITIEKVLGHPKMKAIKNVDLKKIDGNKFVTSLTYIDTETGTEVNIPVEGIFVEIGLVPNTNFAKDLLSLNRYGQIVVDPRTQMTSVPGVWAAGDCTDGLYHQNNIASGDAVKALEDIYLYLRA